MDYCNNKNINDENVCINCGIVHGYKYVHEDIIRNFNMNISTMLYYKKTIHRRKNFL